MTVTLEEETEVSFPFDYKKLAEQVIDGALKAEGFPFEAEVSLLLVPLKAIQELNLEYRGIDAATDVLSFPLISYETPGDFTWIEQEEDNFNPDTNEAMLGDIVLCVDRVWEQAAEFGHSPEREYAFLILHSMLHLLGYDHMTKEDAAVMEEKQRRILNQMGILR
ncbi:rRNA maturation RNase YbeY [Petralouisia muris]|uniref:rRNA maturation RNase YbeY n=1 Tax=Petralouisia muris TaxID=3032872 RepID=A0AC61RXQ6_9FIRM|nr:rRNA maturation RNase YbeY [Petralouisia muris]TGY96705.1 rRNA maturation RNase YbeY [Petralouisia muris]